MQESPAPETPADNGESPSPPPRRMRRLGRPADVASMALVRDTTRAAYHVMYRDIFEKGLLDRRTKELIAIGVASVTGCQGCLTGHIRRARAIGVDMEIIKEVIGVAFAVNAATVVDNSDVAAALLNIESAPMPVPSGDEGNGAAPCA